MSVHSIRLAELIDLYDILQIEKESFDVSLNLRKGEIVRGIKAKKIYLHLNSIDVTSFIWLDVDYKKKTAYIQSLATGRRFRRKGHGRELMNYSLDFLLSNDIITCGLHVYTTNKGAITLYKSLGFVKLDYIENRYGKNQNAYYMEKSLNDHQTTK
jgi:ribosomal protein S18 acetylase RimI-like enzyme